MDVNDSNFLWKFATGTLGVLGIVLGWLGMRVHDKLDKCEEQLSTCITRDELADLMREFKESNTEQHSAVRQTLEKLNERVDSIWEHLAK